MIDRSVTGTKWMKKGFLTALTVFATALLAGCFQSERTVQVKADGSGTVEEIVLLSKALTGMLDSVESGKEPAEPGKEASGEAKAPEPKKKEDRLAEQEKEARAKLAGMGEGVTLVSVTPVQKGDFEGYKAVYAFKDINTLRLASDPTPGSQGAGKATTFRFTRGENSVLVVTNGSATPKEAKDVKEAKAGKSDAPAAAEPAAAEPSQADQQAAMDMLKQMFNGMKLTEKIVVEGTIVESNALFRSGPEITVVDVDFGKLLSTKPDELTKLQSVPQDDKQKLLVAMSRIQGFRVDMNDELRVVFRKNGK